MAANAKSKRKCKGKTFALTTFLGDDQDAPSGYAVVQPRRDWGDTMDNEDLEDRYTLDYKKEEKVVLPTAPKAARGPDVDMTKVPSHPPFTAFLGNLPYDVSEDDISNFFRQMQVKNVRLPRDNGEKGRIRGFGYAEFDNRQDLIAALALNNESLKNRAIKISLAGDHDGDRDRRDTGSDRTQGDWRSMRPEKDDPPRNDSYQQRSGFSDRDSYRQKSSYDRPFERNDRFDRNDRYERNGDRYDRNDRDQDRRGNDRGYGFSDRGMSRGGGRKEEGRYTDRDPPRERYEGSRPSYDSGSGTKERRKLQLAPRTKPIEPVPPPAEAVAASSIFGGAKPVDTAARERQIEERLAKEREVIVPPKDLKESEARVRKFSSGSGISSRSRRSSDSGPPPVLKDEEIYKPPVARQQADSVKSRQRCGSNSSTGSDRDNAINSQHNRKENLNSQGRNGGLNSDYSEPVKGGNRRHSEDRALYEEPKAPVYTSANIYSHLMTDRGNESD